MKRFFVVAVFSFIVHLVGRSTVMTLQECVDTALINNPGLRAAALEVERAAALTGTAFNPPFTSVSLKQEATGGGGPENGVEFAQEFEFPSVYAARYRALKAGHELTRGRLEKMRVEVAVEATLKYYEAVHSRYMIRLNTRLDSIYREFHRVASARFKEGEAGPLEEINAMRVWDANRMEGIGIRKNYDDAVRELSAVIGTTETVAPADSVIAPLPYEGFVYDFSSTAVGRLALGEVAAADRELAVAKNELLPGIKLGATVQALIKGFNPYHIERLPFEKGNFMGFEVGITVPLFFGAPSARVRAAGIESRIARINLENAEMDGMRKSESLQNRIGTLLERIKYYEETGLPRAREMERVAAVSYDLSDISYIEYIANMETAFSVYKEYADCVKEYNDAVINTLLCR